MPQAIAKNGDIVSVLGISSDCPSCGSAREEDECGICGWTEPEKEDEPSPRPRSEPRQLAANRPKQNVVDHIDAHEVVCVICGGDRCEIGGVMQCPTCQPWPEDDAKPAAVPKTLPDIDNQLPADPRCPNCVAQAEAAAKDYGADGAGREPVQVGEREIQVDFFNLGEVSLFCPVCGLTEKLGAKESPAESPVEQLSTAAPQPKETIQEASRTNSEPAEQEPQEVIPSPVSESTPGRTRGRRSKKAR